MYVIKLSSLWLYFVATKWTEMLYIYCLSGWSPGVHPAPLTNFSILLRVPELLSRSPWNLVSPCFFLLASGWIWLTRDNSGNRQIGQSKCLFPGSLLASHLFACDYVSLPQDTAPAWHPLLPLKSLSLFGPPGLGVVRLLTVTVPGLVIIPCQPPLTLTILCKYHLQ